MAKDHLRVEAYGAVDELNAALGLAAAETGHEDIRGLCLGIQRALFDLGSALAAADDGRARKAGLPDLADPEVADLESWIDRLDEELRPLRNFILPGGTRAAAAFHLARTVCRRAERRLVALDRAEPLRGAGLRYLNRLSDLLFTIARVENARAGEPDVEWRGASDRRPR